MTAPIDPKTLRNALGAFTTGVTIVTTRDACGHDVGLTANSFNSVSLDPPLVLWSLARTSGSLPAFEAAEHFAVHILGAGQEAMSGAFAKRGVDKFAGLPLGRGAGGVPLLEGCAARFECRTAYQYDGGDHVIFVGEVLKFEHFDRPPLVFHGGKYGLLLKPAEGEAPSPEPEGAFGEDFLGYLLGRAHFQFYARMRPELEKRDLTELEYNNILAVLSIGDDRSIAELNATVEFTGEHVTEAAARALAERGLITIAGTGDAARLRLTAAGRQTMIELMAVAKAVEIDAERSLDRSESRVLRQLLKAVLRNTDPGLPDLWRRK